MSRSHLGFLAGNITGHYRLSVASGLTTGIAAAGTVFAFRNASSGYIRALIQRIRLQQAVTVPFTAGQELSASVYVARGWSAADTGGTSLTLTGNNGMLNSAADGASQMAINMATTGALTAGTRALDSQPFLSSIGNVGASPAYSSFADEYVLQSDQQFPLNLQSGKLWQNLGNAAGPEGFVVVNNIAQGAAGIVRFAIEIEWVEYDPTTNIGGSS